MPKPQKNPPADAPKTYQLKITLLGASPAIWRRLLVPSTATLGDLHWVIQAAMPWDNSHMHHFYDSARTFYADPSHGLEETQDEYAYRLSDLLKKPKDRIAYEYDLGDSWQHGIELEKILPPDPKLKCALCTAGKRAAPPDDSGGVWGYADMLKTLKNPKSEDHQDIVDWLGGKFDPAAFDLEKINQRLKRVKL